VRVSQHIIHDLVRSGRITAAQGAELIAYRRLLAWKRKPWWERLVLVLMGVRP
jgi:hypothetical protein